MVLIKPYPIAAHTPHHLYYCTIALLLLLRFSWHIRAVARRLISHILEFTVTAVLITVLACKPSYTPHLSYLILSYHFNHKWSYLLSFLSYFTFLIVSFLSYLNSPCHTAGWNAYLNASSPHTLPYLIIS